MVLNAALFFKTIKTTAPTVIMIAINKKIYAFHNPNAKSGISDIVLPLRSYAITYISV